MRVALYARFSSDLQRQTSIDDQLRAARARAAAEGWHVVIERSDSAVSGATPFAMRPGSKALLADALAGRFDVLIVEGLDRTFRDVGEQEQIVKRFEHRGIRIIGTSDGYDTQAKGRKVMRIARGLVNELYLDDLSDKTRRGLVGQFQRGLSAGGRSYGYRTAEAEGGRRMVIDENEAKHVRWIFERYAEGWSPVSIAHELNRLGVPAPRGGTWAVSAIHGSAAKGLGLLNNSTYVGRVVWNRKQWLKDPETGRRRSVDRPRSEWMERLQPELRIVSDALWQQVRARMDRAEIRGTGTSAALRAKQPARTLFGGMMVCPTCGGPVVAIDPRRYGCSVRKDRGPAACGGDLVVPRKALDTRLLAVVREDLSGPSSLAHLQESARTMVAQRLREAGTVTQGDRKRLDEVQEELGRLIDAMTRHGYSSALGDRLRVLETERAQLQQQVARGDMPEAAALVEALVTRYREAMMDLKQRLEGDVDRQRTRDLLREMLGPVLLERDADGAIWAHMAKPAERLMAVSGFAYSDGCGGPQRDDETAPRPRKRIKVASA